MAERDVTMGVPLLSGVQLLPQDSSVQSVNGVQFQVAGSEIQTLEAMLQPQQMMRCEPGAMVHMHHSLYPKIGTDGSFRQALMRCCCAGEAFFRLTYQNNTPEPVAIAISPPWPAKVVAFDMSTYPKLHTQRGAFFGAVASKIDFNLKLAKDVGSALCGGQGIWFNEMSGDGVAFSQAVGRSPSVRSTPTRRSYSIRRRCWRGNPQ